MLRDTIASIATAKGASGIGIVRISGENAIETADRIVLNSRLDHDLLSRKPNTIRFSYLVDGDGNILDEMLVSVMKAPFSYTGEDVVELNTHGGHYVLKQALLLAIQNGARLAMPGEFTKRAFLNGRIDLTKAEAVMDIISSENSMALKNAAAQLSGALSAKIDPLRKSILHETARIEAALDDPEHFSLDGYADTLLDMIGCWEEEISSLKNTFEEGKHIKDGIPTAIIGAPNAGKSSLMNRLLNEERAIVTEIAGTTRDTIAEKVTLGGVMLLLTDTAGLTDTPDPVERIGIERALKTMEDAEIVFYVIDSSKEAVDIPPELKERMADKTVYALLNKSDLKSAYDEEARKNLEDSLPEGAGIFEISALTGDGISEIEEALRERHAFSKEKTDEEFFLTNIRHSELLDSALSSLSNVRQSIEDKMSEDLFSIDLTDAYVALSSVVGEDIDEDLCDEIFSSFCMGK